MGIDSVRSMLKDHILSNCGQCNRTIIPTFTYMMRYIFEMIVPNYHRRDLTTDDITALSSTWGWSCCQTDDVGNLSVSKHKW